MGNNIMARIDGHIKLEHNIPYSGISKASMMVCPVIVVAAIEAKEKEQKTYFCEL